MVTSSFSFNYDLNLLIEANQSPSIATGGALLRYGYKSIFFDLGFQSSNYDPKFKDEYSSDQDGFSGAFIDSKGDSLVYTTSYHPTWPIARVFLGLGYRKNYFRTIELRHSIKFRTQFLEGEKETYSYNVNNRESYANTNTSFDPDELQVSEFIFTNEARIKINPEFPVSIYLLHRMIWIEAHAQFLEDKKSLLNFGGGLEWNIAGNWSSRQHRSIIKSTLADTNATNDNSLTYLPQRLFEADLGFSLGSHPAMMDLGLSFSLLPYTYFKWGLSFWNKTAKNSSSQTQVYVNYTPSKDEGGDQFLMAGIQIPTKHKQLDLLRVGYGVIFEGYASGYHYKNSENESDGIQWMGHVIQAQLAYAIFHSMPINFNISYIHRNFESFDEEFSDQVPVDLSANEVRAGLSVGFGYYN